MQVQWETPYETGYVGGGIQYSSMFWEVVQCPIGTAIPIVSVNEKYESTTLQLPQWWALREPRMEHNAAATMPWEAQDEKRAPEGWGAYQK